MIEVKQKKKQTPLISDTPRRTSKRSRGSGQNSPKTAVLVTPELILCDQLGTQPTLDNSLSDKNPLQTQDLLVMSPGKGFPMDIDIEIEVSTMPEEEVILIEDSNSMVEEILRVSPERTNTPPVDKGKELEVAPVMMVVQEEQRTPRRILQITPRTPLTRSRTKNQIQADDASSTPIKGGQRTARGIISPETVPEKKKNTPSVKKPGTFGKRRKKKRRRRNSRKKTGRKKF